MQSMGTVYSKTIENFSEIIAIRRFSMIITLK